MVVWNIPLRAASLSLVNSSQGLFRAYVFGYSHRTLSVTFQSRVSANDVSTPSSSTMAAGHQFLNNCVKVLLLVIPDRREVMRQLHVEIDVGQIQQHIPARFILWEYMRAIGKSEGIKLSELPNKVTETVLSDSTIFALIKQFPNFATVSEKEHNKKFVTTSIVNIVKDISGSVFLTGRGIQSYYKYNRVSKMFLSTRAGLLWWDSWIVTKLALNV